MIDELIGPTQQLSCAHLLAHEREISTHQARVVLWDMCRDIEHEFVDLKERVVAERKETKAYCGALGYLMSGNELWRRITGRLDA